MVRQQHFGREFYLDKKTGYWISTSYSKKMPRCRAHQWVWICTHGPIPKNFHIHHKDGNKSNNLIENLEIIEKGRHMSLHMQDPEKKKRASIHAAKIRPLTKAWHGSEEGLAWHKANGILGWIHKKPIEIACKVCGLKTLTKTYHQDFCSNKCKSKWRRESGLDDIEKRCKGCGENFKINKYSRTKCCSKKCGGIYRKMLRHM